MLSPETGSVSPSASAILGFRSRGRTVESAWSFAPGDFARASRSNMWVSPSLTSKGIMLMDSVPPATMRSACPAAIFSCAWAIDSMPEAQFRCTVKAGTRSGIPARSATTRATFVDSEGWATFPMTTSSISLGSTPVRASSSETAMRPSAEACTSASAVPALAKGVR